MGLLLEHWAETTFRSPALVATTMFVMGAVLLVADRRASGDRARLSLMSVTVGQALAIGFAQGLALIPGVSRSGATISTGLFLGMKREDAARFSFLLATPITFGAAAVKVPHLLRSEDGSGVWLGMLAAAVVGLLSIRVLLAYVRTRDYRPFVYYRFAFAALVAVVLLVR
jgi:undecaprenyl-diphosphatase